PREILQGPELCITTQAASMPPAKVPPADKGMPINLATALRLSDARPLMIAAAQAKVQIAAAQLEKAQVLWMPNVNVAVGAIMHAGGTQQVNGGLVTQGTNFLYAGGSLELRFAMTDAIFAPLAAQQELHARKADVQTARNDAVLAMAEAYFNVQQARG